MKIGIPVICLAVFGIRLTSAAAQTDVAIPHCVAAGDIDQSSAVLWGRFTVAGPVLFEYSRDATFGEIDGAMEALGEDGEQPVKVEIRGLLPATSYYYRVFDADGHSASGRFRTAAEEGLTGLRFGASGDSRGDLTPFASMSNVPDRDLDFFVLLGDTVYADWPFASQVDSTAPRPAARTLPEFRSRYIEVLSERFGINWIVEMRRSTALFAVIDDHEVINDFAGGASPVSDPRFDDAVSFINETERYRNGLSAFLEFHPLRDEHYGETGDPRTAGKPKLYRYRTFGADAAVIILDARSFRDAPLDMESLLPSRRAYIRWLERSFDPTRTMLGAAQLQRLEADLLDAHTRGVTWKFIVVPEPIQLLGPTLAADRFEGYAHERSRILRFIRDNEIANVVFVSADIHTSLIGQLTYQEAPASSHVPVSAFEVVTGPVAYAAPLGPTAMALAPASVRRWYEQLGPVGQNTLLTVIGNAILDFYRLPPIGLRQTVVNARLLEGAYLSGNTYGWTEFDIDAGSQCLTITSWGVPWYDEQDLSERPDYVLELTPRVVSRIQVEPTLTPGMAAFDADLRPCPSDGALCGALDAGSLAMLPLMMLVLRGRARPRHGLNVG